MLLRLGRHRVPRQLAFCLAEGAVGVLPQAHGRRWRPHVPVAHLAGNTLLWTPGNGNLRDVTVNMLWLLGTSTCILRSLPFFFSKPAQPAFEPVQMPVATAMAMPLAAMVYDVPIVPATPFPMQPLSFAPLM